MKNYKLNFLQSSDDFERFPSDSTSFSEYKINNEKPSLEDMTILYSNCLYLKSYTKFLEKLQNVHTLSSNEVLLGIIGTVDYFKSNDCISDKLYERINVYLTKNEVNNKEFDVGDFKVGRFDVKEYTSFNTENKNISSAQLKVKKNIKIFFTERLPKIDFIKLQEFYEKIEIENNCYYIFISQLHLMDANKILQLSESCRLFDKKRLGRIPSHLEEILILKHIIFNINLKGVVHSVSMLSSDDFRLFLMDFKEENEKRLARIINR
ncbi:hypothetical protein NUSPORA_02576 [Nucleospora cyclopteri]